MIERVQPAIAISHSFCAVATTYSLAQNSHLRLDKYVLITCPDEFLERIEAVAHNFGLSKKIVEGGLLKLSKIII